jgi:hypothetical protein
MSNCELCLFPPHSKKGFLFTFKLITGFQSPPQRTGSDHRKEEKQTDFIVLKTVPGRFSSSSSSSSFSGRSSSSSSSFSVSSSPPSSVSCHLLSTSSPSEKENILLAKREEKHNEGDRTLLQVSRKRILQSPSPSPPSSPPSFVSLSPSPSAFTKIPSPSPSPSLPSSPSLTPSPRSYFPVSRIVREIMKKEG